MNGIALWRNLCTSVVGVAQDEEVVALTDFGKIVESHDVSPHISGVNTQAEILKRREIVKFLESWALSIKTLEIQKSRDGVAVTIGDYVFLSGKWNKSLDFGMLEGSTQYRVGAGDYWVKFEHLSEADRAKIIGTDLDLDPEVLKLYKWHWDGTEYSFKKV